MHSLPVLHIAPDFLKGHDKLVISPWSGPRDNDSDFLWNSFCQPIEDKPSPAGKPAH